VYCRPIVVLRGVRVVARRPHDNSPDLASSSSRAQKKGPSPWSRVMAPVERSWLLARLHHPVLVSMPRERVVVPGSRVGANDTASRLPAAAVPRRETFVRLTGRILQ
jgi:hypothetical protein